MTSAIGSESVTASSLVSVTQSGATSFLGTTSFVGSVSVAVTQSAMTSAVGSVVVVPSIEVPVTQSVMTSAIGNPFVSIDVTPIIIGVSAIGSTGEENVWGLIVPDQTANFSNITVSQTPNWIQIAA